MESDIVVDGWVAVCVESDMDISQSTVIEHSSVMDLITTFVVF